MKFAAARDRGSLQRPEHPHWNASNDTTLKESYQVGWQEDMAEREGFEPSEPVRAHTISSRADSASSRISPLYK
jgi:hypothetical protein